MLTQEGGIFPKARTFRQSPFGLLETRASVSFQNQPHPQRDLSLADRGCS